LLIAISTDLQVSRAQISLFAAQHQSACVSDSATPDVVAGWPKMPYILFSGVADGDPAANSRRWPRPDVARMRRMGGVIARDANFLWMT
jgi:hypothetical protein